ncbi:MAG: cysteine--tRNA ligase [Egibacteraceae bacterium]
MRLYNTLTRSVEEFVPRDEGQVTIYVCGPTVQGPPHFGHVRMAIVPDVLRRYLEWQGYDVLHVRNITDVEDKIIATAHLEGRSAAVVAEDYARTWQQGIDALGCLPPHVVPRATGHILEMQELIARLIELDVAYPSGGDVYFSVRAFDGYGKLSRRDPDQLRAGSRVAAGEQKRDPLDFALWKASKPDEPSWPSPWGDGRPGWHIECSAMATKYLGQPFDIHMGGTDLVFPHHENELAQSEAATSEQFARFWVHHGMLNFGQEKMAKSVGNTVSLAEAVERYGSDTVRLFFLRADYRSPVEFSEERLDEAAAALERFTAFLRVADALTVSGRAEVAEQARAAFREAMDDDLATPRAHAVLFDLVRDGHRALETGDEATAVGARDALRELTGVLGYRLEAAAAVDSELVASLVSELLSLRAQARSRRDFATADAIRERLEAAGVAVEDTPEGARWHVTRGG